MRKRDGWFLIACIVVLIALIFLEPSYGWKVQAWLVSRPALQTDSPSLTAQNEALRAQLAELQGIAAQLPHAPAGYLRAMVYSRYPMNFKNEILVNAGANNGVVAGKSVLFQGILIGTVQKVFTDTALVQTVFDSNFKMPVRVGAGGYDALLMGGASPKATSLTKTAPVRTGDIVYAAGETSPYGLPVALVASTSTSPDNLFEEATLSFGYDVNGIQSVFIAQ